MMLTVKTKSNVIIVYKYQELMLLFLQLFYFSHHFYIVWWALLILHAPNFWKWFIGPAVIYLAERIMRLRIVNRARYGKTVIQEGITYPSKVSKCFCNFFFKLVLACIYFVRKIFVSYECSMYAFS